MKTKEELAIEYCEYTVSKMDDETVRKIAVINLLANIDQETDIATWEDYVAQMKGLHNAEALLELIRPSMLLRENNDG
jgi:hypothetical protein|tara:strand:- start:5320 stop:5553 length:234 start_codon:yes stop_codon:yes gene_type:complete